MTEYTALEALLEDTKDSESPVRFKLWAYLFVIGAITKRSIYYRLKGILKLYPNLYVMLIADSGFGKQFPITMATKLLRTLNITRNIIGQSSIQGIIDPLLSKVITLENGVIIRNAEGAVISSEFSNMLVTDLQALTLLTELYDTEHLDIWEKNLVRGQVRLRNVFLSFLTGTNLEHYNDKVQEKDIRGGFIARTLCIHETEIGALNSLMEEGPDIDWEKHCGRLREISKLAGPMSMSRDAKQLYDNWYYSFYKDPPVDKTGWVRRAREHVIKVAMCLSLIDRDDLIITKEHIADSMDFCFKVMKDVVNIAKKSGKSKYRSQYAIITMELIKAPGHMMKRQRLLNKHLGEFTWKEFAETIETLVQGGYVENVEIDGEAGIKLTAKHIEELESKQ